jgi:hypothetical protein
LASTDSVSPPTTSSRPRPPPTVPPSYATSSDRPHERLDTKGPQPTQVAPPSELVRSAQTPEASGGLLPSFLSSFDMHPSLLPSTTNARSEADASSSNIPLPSKPYLLALLLMLGLTPPTAASPAPPPPASPLPSCSRPSASSSRPYYAPSTASLPTPTAKGKERASSPPRLRRASAAKRDEVSEGSHRILVDRYTPSDEGLWDIDADWELYGVVPSVVRIHFPLAAQAQFAYLYLSTQTHSFPCLVLP